MERASSPSANEARSRIRGNFRVDRDERDDMTGRPVPNSGSSSVWF